MVPFSPRWAAATSSHRCDPCMLCMTFLPTLQPLSLEQQPPPHTAVIHVCCVWHSSPHCSLYPWSSSHLFTQLWSMYVVYDIPPHIAASIPGAAATSTHSCDPCMLCMTFLPTLQPLSLEQQPPLHTAVIHVCCVWHSSPHCRLYPWSSSHLYTQLWSMYVVYAIPPHIAASTPGAAATSSHSCDPCMLCMTFLPTLQPLPLEQQPPLHTAVIHVCCVWHSSPHCSLYPWSSSHLFTQLWSMYAVYDIPPHIAASTPGTPTTSTHSCDPCMLSLLCMT